jgi:hypothetical protein
MSFLVFHDTIGACTTMRSSSEYAAGSVPATCIFTAVLGDQNHSNSGAYSSILMGNGNSNTVSGV